MRESVATDNSEQDLQTHKSLNHPESSVHMTSHMDKAANCDHHPEIEKGH